MQRLRLMSVKAISIEQQRQLKCFLIGRRFKRDSSNGYTYIMNLKPRQTTFLWRLFTRWLLLLAEKKFGDFLFLTHSDKQKLPFPSLHIPERSNTADLGYWKKCRIHLFTSLPASQNYVFVHYAIF